jgi:hypothetical protein
MSIKKYAAVALFAGLALSIPGAALADGSGSGGRGIPRADQPRVADTTMKLESAFDKQFVDGTIDRNALAGPIDDVLRAMPEEARPVVKAHIDVVLDQGERLAARMTPEQRQGAVSPPPAEKVGKTQQAQLVAWGWPGYAGWGGYGAFGFPGMYGPALGGVGWGGYGWGYPGWGAAGWGYGATTVATSYSTSYAAVYPFSAYSVWGPYAGWGGGWGCLGLGGWGW